MMLSYKSLVSCFTLFVLLSEVMEGQGTPTTYLSPKIRGKKRAVDSGTRVGDRGSKKWLELETPLPAQIIGKLNSEVTLECIAVGSPPPAIYWLKDGKTIEAVGRTERDNQVVDGDISSSSVARSPLRNPLLSTGFSMAKVKSKLPLGCLRPEAAGQYTCVATNHQGRRLLSTTSLTFQDEGEGWSECEGVSYSKKRAAFILSSESFHMETIGNDVILACQGAGRPRPRLSWRDAEGRKILNGKKFTVTEGGNLLIRSLSWKEMGEYNCEVENSFGRETAPTFLYPLMGEQES